MKEFVLYCDEGEKRGKKYSDFYGGLLVHSGKIEEINQRLNVVKKLHFHNDGEIKGTGISKHYADKYIAFLSEVFAMMREDLFKIRIMFTDNRHLKPQLSSDDNKTGYFKLYYQFIKHAFGFRYYPRTTYPVLLKIYLDYLPDQSHRKADFRHHLHRLMNTNTFIESGIMIEEQHIAEICSKKHILSQALDVILHLIEFRLNEKHLVLQPETNKKSGKSKAKLKVYKYMLKEIQTIYPRFNIGITTGRRLGVQSYWIDEYRHWIFESKTS